MARLWRDQGKVQQARELLAPVYGWFTEGVRHARSEGGEGVAGWVGFLEWQQQLAKVGDVYEWTSDISMLYREFPDALAEVLAENAADELLNEPHGH
jgi:hypothetical protein